MPQLNKNLAKASWTVIFLRLIKDGHLLRSQKEEKQMEPEGKLDFPKRSLGDFFFSLDAFARVRAKVDKMDWL